MRSARVSVGGFIFGFVFRCTIALFAPVVCLFSLVVWTAPAMASDAATLPQSLASVQARLANTRVLHSDFEQVRELKLLQKPLVSRGTLLYQKNAGICWQLSEPVPATVYLSRQKVTVSDSVSSNTLANSNPALQLFSDLLFSVFAGDIDALKDRFDLTWKPDADGWLLVLQPQDSLMETLVNSVSISGREHIRQVKLMHKGGDQTTLNFHQTRVNPAPDGITHECENGAF